MISILEPFENRNNGEENIYVSAPIEILSSEPIYDELEERPFESVFTKVLSNEPMYDIYEESESDDVGSRNQCIVCLFEQQSLESRKPISSILEKEFQGNIKPNVVVSVGYDISHTKEVIFNFILFHLQQSRKRNLISSIKQ